MEKKLDLEKNKNLITTGVIVLVVAIVSFFAGTKYQTNKDSVADDSRPGFNQTNNGTAVNNGLGSRGNNTAPSNLNNGQAGFQGGMINGEITAIDDSSITIKTDDGSKIVVLSTSTNYQESIEISLSDLTVGATVSVNGDSNSDGSVTAKSIIVGKDLSAPLMDGTGRNPIEN